MRPFALMMTIVAAWLASPSEPRVVFVGDSITALAPWRDLCPGALNLGLPAAGVAAIRSHVAASVLPRRFTAVVMAGINDAIAGRPANVRGLVSDLQARGAVRVIVHPVLPTTPAYPRDLSRQIAAINSDLPGEVVPFTVVPAGYKGDGVHLRPSGYRAWLSALQQRGVCR